MIGDGVGCVVRGMPEKSGLWRPLASVRGDNSQKGPALVAMDACCGAAGFFPEGPDDDTTVVFATTVFGLAAAAMSDFKSVR